MGTILSTLNGLAGAATRPEPAALASVEPMRSTHVRLLDGGIHERETRARREARAARTGFLVVAGAAVALLAVGLARRNAGARRARASAADPGSPVDEGAGLFPPHAPRQSYATFAV
jgi:hypothetical protein